jgi:GTP-binding protein
MTQAKTRPPTFVVFSSMGDELPDDYKRYILNGIREDFDLPGIPLRLMVRQRKNPYADD